jgi:hypothetical protein
MAVHGYLSLSNLPSLTSNQAYKYTTKAELLLQSLEQFFTKVGPTSTSQQSRQQAARPLQ